MLGITLYNQKATHAQNMCVLIIPPSTTEMRVEIHSRPCNKYKVGIAIDAPREIKIIREDVPSNGQNK